MTNPDKLMERVTDAVEKVAGYGLGIQAHNKAIAVAKAAIGAVQQELNTLNKHSCDTGDFTECRACIKDANTLGINKQPTKPSES